jgi:hypothetical protein
VPPATPAIIHPQTKEKEPNLKLCLLCTHAGIYVMHVWGAVFGGGKTGSLSTVSLALAKYVHDISIYIHACTATHMYMWVHIACLD